MNYFSHQRTSVIDPGNPEADAAAARRDRPRPVVLRDVGLSERLERLYDVKVDDDRRMRRLVHERRRAQAGRERSCGCGLRQHRIAKPSEG
ncbi:hypothetical protein NONI108955_21835 [Nocardia ninae]|uniref:hypothetical protein n=1 Tax=Nocardia ninae TaxID=356145 RepID=UPI0011BFD3F3|nr:hypothetical protein [Nocardia ninae]